MLKTQTTVLSKGLVKVEKIFEEPPLKKQKALRADELYNATVEFQGNTFDADERSMDRMSRILSVAANLYTTKVNSGISHQQAYTECYSVELPWKLANNSIQLVTPAQLAEVLNLAMQNMSTIWFKY